MSITVIRRCGTPAPLDISKIRDVVAWACEGFNVEPVALESSLTTRLRDGVTTREIQDNLINCALEMCSPQEPDWRYVAGRLHIWGLRKDTRVRRCGELYDGYAARAIAKVGNGSYDSRILSYAIAELVEAGSWIKPDYDRDYDYAGAVLLTRRYLQADELPQEALLTCALLIASVETDHDRRMYWACRIYHAIAQRKISLATPILSNLRTPGGSLASCFITAMDDNLESIFHEVTNTARISKGGGGVGVCLSAIRATGSRVMGKDNASGGVLPWAKLLNDTAVAVNQGGSRAGACTIALDVWHYDVPDFLECQTEAGDVRKKVYDVFPQLVILDEFMRRVEACQDWTLVDPHEVRTVLGIDLPPLWGDAFVTAYREVERACDDGRLTLYKRVNARHLFKEAMRSQIETGLPYMNFKDTINRFNPNKHEGYIPCGNLCQESWSVVKSGEFAHVCNLVSLNLANIEDYELADHCETAVRILDNTIELTTPPFEESAFHNDRFRTIGVGAMGLADWLAKNERTYEFTATIGALFEDIGYHCTRASMELAKKRGAYPAFPGSEWSKGRLIGGHDPEDLARRSHSPQRWIQLSEDIKRHGIRNSHITAIAPNTSSSLVQGCTASILPTFSKFHYDKWAKGTVPVAPPFIGDRFWYYTENKVIDQRIVIDAVAVIQFWIDTGVSMELMFNLNEGIYHDGAITAPEIYNTLIHAWRSGCKAIYYVRTVQKDSYKEADGCVSCAN